MALFFESRVANEATVRTTCTRWHNLHSLLAVGTSANKISVYNEEAEQVENMVVERDAVPTCLDWHPMQRILVAGWSDGGVSLYADHDKGVREDKTIHKRDVATIQVRWSFSQTRRAPIARSANAFLRACASPSPCSGRPTARGSSRRIWRAPSVCGRRMTSTASSPFPSTTRRRRRRRSPFAARQSSATRASPRRYDFRGNRRRRDTARPVPCCTAATRRLRPTDAFLRRARTFPIPTTAARHVPALLCRRRGRRRLLCRRPGPLQRGVQHGRRADCGAAVL